MVWVVFTNLVAQSAFSICAPMLPLEFERKGISGFYTGITFACYSIGYLTWPPMVTKLSKTVDVNLLLYMGLGIMGVAFFIFGFIKDLESRANILALSFVLRLIHGMSCSTGFVTCCLIVTNEYPN